MKEKTKKTKNGQEYWIHSYKNGFFYFSNSSNYISFFKENYQSKYGNLILKYKSDYIIGIENISHYCEENGFIVPFVFSHDVVLKRESKSYNSGRRHRKCYSYRRPQMGSVIRGTTSLILEEKELKNNYTIRIKQRKKSMETVGWFFDDYSQYRNENNWKSDRRKMRKSWQKKYI